MEYEKGEKEYASLIEEFVRNDDTSIRYDLLDIDFNALEKENPDIIGWLYIPKTKISYPVVQGSDNVFYLHHDFHKKSNIYGTVFADCNIEDITMADNLILYGHNMKNGSMFGGLKRYLNEDFYKKHKEIHFYTKERVYIYDVFAVYTAQMNDAEAYKLSIKDLASYKEKAVKRTMFQTKPSLDDGKILTLSTCHGASGTRIRCLIQASRISTIDYED